jgi:hypothetical protein
VSSFNPAQVVQVVLLLHQVRLGIVLQVLVPVVPHGNIALAVLSQVSLKVLTQAVVQAHLTQVQVVRKGIAQVAQVSTQVVVHLAAKDIVQVQAQKNTAAAQVVRKDTAAAQVVQKGIAQAQVAQALTQVPQVIQVVQQVVARKEI